MTAAVLQTTSSSDFSFTDQDFRRIADLANKRYGLFLQPSKKALVYSRLAKRLRALNLPDFESYCALLDRPEAETERPFLLSALTTNVTHFFREMHHFETLRDIIAPQLLEKARNGQAVRLWSSACSAGQEAYCIAAALLAGAPDITKYDFRILATDIDPNIITKAKQATYPAEQIEAIPSTWRERLLVSGSAKSQHITIRDELRQLISFGELNLIEDWPMQRKFDVIMCRNAAIYFDKQTQARLWQRFAGVMETGAHLMIGHSERLSGPATTQFESVGITTYRKQDGPMRSAQPDMKEGKT
ncbi:protein-glutamate O-methyltransferase [Yoonia sp. F2084L]|uniref:CheR family methyltransferase n=1 Tax=Yoonia sp. F2084L TaxID=2926419 RepID=UPI001FF3F36A|nr:protein-glutamate O-methyltransferase [Yoonia sp. F2084L]MCK0095584.1 protein-glutamate O-methyltransferase [Yoonia sp. F2084L]